MSNGYKCHQPGYTILHWMICLWHSWHSWHCTLVFQISFWFTRLLQTNLQTSGWHSLTKRVMLQVSGKVTKNSCWMYCSYHVRALPLEKRPVIWIYIYIQLYIYIYIHIYSFIYLFIYMLLFLHEQIPCPGCQTSAEEEPPSFHHQTQVSHDADPEDFDDSYQSDQTTEP